jgi:hypothetical protein
MLTVSTIRSALFAGVGIAFLSHWLVTDPGYDSTDSQSEWSHVLWFSAIILALGFALVLFGRMVGGQWVVRLTLFAGAAAVLGSVANILEDGLSMGWAFWGFILSLALLDVTLLGLTIVIVRGGDGARRWLAVVPASTLLAIVFYVAAGGVVMLAAWLAAAAAALVLPVRAPVHESLVSS